MSTSTSTSVVPSITLNDGNRDPAARLRGLPDPTRGHRAAVDAALETGYRHIDTAEMYRNERGVGEAIRASGLDRDEVYVTSKLNNGYHSPTTRATRSTHTLSALGVRLRRPVPHPLAAARLSMTATSSRPGRRSRSSSARAAPARSASPTSRSRTSSGSPPRPSHAGGQPDRAAPVPPNEPVRAYGEAARHRHRGVVPDRSGRGPRRSGDHRDRRAALDRTARAGRAALAPRARQHRLPQVHTPARITEELRAVRLRARARATSTPSTRSTAARTAAPDRTQTPSRTPRPSPSLRSTPIEAHQARKRHPAAPLGCCSG